MQNRFHNGVNPRREVSRRTVQPVHDIKTRWPICIKRYWVSVEEIGSDDEIAISSKLIRDELHVDESVTDDICEDQDCPLG
jgi:hypothetical protein